MDLHFIPPKYKILQTDLSSNNAPHTRHIAVPVLQHLELIFFHLNSFAFLNAITKQTFRLQTFISPLCFLCCRSFQSIRLCSFQKYVDSFHRTIRWDHYSCPSQRSRTICPCCHLSRFGRFRRRIW